MIRLHVKETDFVMHLTLSQCSIWPLSCKSIDAQAPSDYLHHSQGIIVKTFGVCNIVYIHIARATIPQPDKAKVIPTLLHLCQSYSISVQYPISDVYWCEAYGPLGGHCPITQNYGSCVHIYACLGTELL